VFWQFTDRLHAYFFKLRKLMHQNEEGDTKKLNKSRPAI